MHETVEKTGTGAILYDRSVINQISAADFSGEGWDSASPIKGSLRSAGRGETLFVSDRRGEFVLKHYLRGGLVARVNRDRYGWRGEQRNRAFAEWRLLAKINETGLPVPRPAAARYVRRGMWYRADLLTVRKDGIIPLSTRIAREADDEFWRHLGQGIRRFHDAGVCHADLNAYNVQLDRDEGLFVLDFDRGSIRPPGGWAEENLARLHRSLSKLKRLDSNLHFNEADWAQLIDGYER